MTVRIIRGLPGSGKSTFAKTFGCFHVEADMFFVRDGEYKWLNTGENHDWCFACFKEAVCRGIDVCVSNTFTTMREMRPYLEFATEKGAKVEVYAMKNDYGNTHDVPAETLSKMAARWEKYDGEVEIVNSDDAQIVTESDSCKSVYSDSMILEKMSESKFVRKRELPGTDGIVSYNYDKKAFYKGAWDDATIHARGLFVRDGKVVARSFDKFFRINENERSSEGRIRELLERKDLVDVSVFRKYNGYLGICAWDDERGEWFIASKSANSGPYADAFRVALDKTGFLSFMETRPMSSRLGHSFVFEVFDPVRDPHFAKECEDGVGCRLLAVFRNDLHNDGLTVPEIASLLKVGIGPCRERMAESLDMDVSGYASLMASLEHFVSSERCVEGLVVQLEFANGEMFRFKVKTAWYSFWKYVRGKIFGSDRAEDHPSIPIYPGKPEEFIEPGKWMDVAIGIVNSMKWSEIDALKTPDMFGNPRLNMQKLIGIVEKRLVLERVEF